MKQAKKSFSILLSSLALVTLLAACGNSGSTTGSTSSTDPGSSSPPAATAKLAKISIFQSKVEIANQLEALAKQYTKETGNEVDVWGAAGDAYDTQLQAKLAANQGPTIFDVGPGAEADKFKSYLADLSSQPIVKDIAPNQALIENGKTVGIPYGVEGFGLVYNKNLVKPGSITDLNSFTTVLKDLKAKGISGLELSKEDYFLIGHIINTPFALMPDPQGFIDKLNKGEVKMADTKQFQDWAKFMDVIKANTKNPMQTTYDSQMGDFATGKTAMVHQGNWAYSMLSSYKTNFGIGMMPFPLDGNNKLAVGVASYWVVNSTASPDEIKAADAFLNWLYTSDTGKNAIVNEFHFIPAMTNIKADNLDPLSQAVFEATKSGNTIPWAFNYFPQGIITNELAPAAQAYFLDKNMTGEQFLKNLDAAWANGAKQ
jgi:raffinose/stachyose/melibiose transport system substrate-binding protein